MQPRRTGRWIKWAAAGVAAALVALMLVGWRLMPTQAERAVAELPASPTTASVTSRQPRPATGNLALPPEQAASVPAGFVEACGLGWVKDSASLYTSPPAVTAASDALRPKLIAAWLAGSDERLKAVAYLLQMTEPEPGYRTALAEATERCGSDEQPPCTQADLPAWRETAQAPAARVALAKLAMTTRDPAVYALALQQCQKMVLDMRSATDADGACSQLSARRWAQLDPDNGMAWLRVAGDATDRGNAHAIEEVMHRLATVSGYRTNFGLGAAAVLNAATEGSPIAKQSLAVELLAVEAAAAVPGLQPIVMQCSKEQVTDANRRQLCATVADRMVDTGDTLLVAGIGRAIGERTGWSSERTQRSKDELRVLQDSAASWLVADSLAPGSCAMIERTARYVAAAARLGEMAAMRQLAASSGRSMDDLIANHRRRQAADATAAAASAAAPAWASASASR